MHLSFHRHNQAQPAPEPAEIAPAHLRELSTLFAAPRWLSDLGRSAWLMVGVLLVIGGLAWLLAATETIVGPVLVAMIIATVAMPIVSWLARHMPRIAAAALVLLGLVALAVMIAVLVVAGISGQSSALAKEATAAAQKVQGWAEDLGVDTSGASGATQAVERDVPKIIHTLTTGLISGIRGLTSLIFGLSLAALSTFFLLKDGPVMRRWIDSHVGMPQPVAHTISTGVIRSLRGYFRGVTLIAAFNAVVVGLGALLLGVPLAGTIAIVSFVTAYIPFIGAFFAGTLAVVVALGAKGTTTALIMLLIVILANGLLQNLVQPFAMGAALDLNPLVVLVATIGAGCIFGTLGLILAAPLLSAAVHITKDLARARALAALEATGPPGETMPPVGEPSGVL